MADINDLLSAAINSTPVEFGAAISDMLTQRAHDAIDVRRIEIAQGIYNNDVPDEAGVDDNDIDLDVSDFDADLDLEGINGQDD